MNRGRTPQSSVRAVRTRQDFYEFAMFYGFRTNLDRHYVPTEGDQVLFYWSDISDTSNTASVTTSLAEVVFKFGRPHLRLFSESGFRDSSLPRDFSFFGRMMRVSGA